MNIAAAGGVRHHAFVQEIRELLRVRTGLVVREEDIPRMGETLAERIRASDSRDYDSYLSLLQSQTEAGRSEWTALISRMTNGESYFFRDRGQFSLLRSWILPDLIRRRATERSLRIWSAGCSTGEEPYSLAITVREILPERERWNVQIYGTDINEKALAQARRGVYEPWSMRSVKPEELSYFREVAGKWKLDDRVRAMVTFQWGNLVSYLPEASDAIADIDLILCRNVLIYFDSEGVSAAASRCAAALREGGYLLTGHTELHGHSLYGLKPRMYSESMVYQRDSEKKAVPAALEPRVLNGATTHGLSPNGKLGVQSPKSDRRTGPLAVRGRAPANTSGDTLAMESKDRGSDPNSHGSNGAETPGGLEQARQLMASGDYAGVIRATRSLLTGVGPPVEAFVLAARAYANLGDYPRALQTCQAGIRVNPVAPECYFLMGQVAEAQGESLDAQDLFRKAIYLAPEFVPAYLELASTLVRSGDESRARKLREAALAILRSQPGDHRVGTYDGITVGALRIQLEEMLGG